MMINLSTDVYGSQSAVNQMNYEAFMMQLVGMFFDRFSYTVELEDIYHRGITSLIGSI